MPERIWVITGTSSGFGLAIAQHVLAQGDKVVATVRSLGKLPTALRNPGAQPLILDLTDSDDIIHQTAIRAIQIHGRVDVLVNNAGTSSALGPIEEVSMSSIRAQFQENLFGTIAFTQPFIAHFLGVRSGHIINISSMGAFVNYPGVGAYSASKAALESFSDSLSREVAPFGVRVYIVVPGYFPTNIIGPPPDNTADEAAIPVAEGSSKLYTDEGSLGHVGDPDVLARRVYELVADIGMAKNFKMNGRPWLRMFLGSDSGEEVSQKLTGVLENCRAIEPIWRSTDVKYRLTKL